MKMRAPFEYERVRFYNEREGKHQFIILAKIDNKITKKNNISFKQTFVEAGSGSLPTEKIPSIALVFKSSTFVSFQLHKLFLSCDLPVIGYINNNKYFIDLKAIPNNQINNLIENINEVLK